MTQEAEVVRQKTEQKKKKEIRGEMGEKVEKIELETDVFLSSLL
jgi:hypothetical protein